jgi:thymidylate synthase ThyX
MDSHAQQEIQDYSKAMYEMVVPHFPLCCEAFEDYVLEAKTFSKQEMEVLKYEMAGSKAFALEGLSKRERTEFLEKIGD